MIPTKNLIKYSKSKGKDSKVQKEPEFMPEEKSYPDTSVEPKEELQKLTEEQKQKIICFFDVFASEYFIDEDEDPDSEYTTEYALLMKQKDEEFKNYLLEDREPSEIKVLLEMCDEYMKKRKTGKIQADLDLLLRTICG